MSKYTCITIKSYLDVIIEMSSMCACVHVCMHVAISDYLSPLRSLGEGSVLALSWPSAKHGSFNCRKEVIKLSETFPAGVDWVETCLTTAFRQNYVMCLFPTCLIQNSFHYSLIMKCIEIISKQYISTPHNTAHKHLHLHLLGHVLWYCDISHLFIVVTEHNRIVKSHWISDICIVTWWYHIAKHSPINDQEIIKKWMVCWLFQV